MQEAYLFSVMTAMAASWCAIAVPDCWSVVLAFITYLAFPAACAFTALRGPEASAFFAGCGYGIANALGSVGVAQVLARFITNDPKMYLPPLIEFFIGVLIWGLMAIPICGLFRWIFGRYGKS